MPSPLETVLSVRRLTGDEVLRIGLQVCDHWRRSGVHLSDIRPHNLLLAYDGAIIFPQAIGESEPAYVGLRALGGVLARALDRSQPDAQGVATFVEELAATAPDASLSFTRAEIHQRLAGATGDDDLDAQTITTDAATALGADHPAASLNPRGVLDPSGPTYVPVAPGPGEADPYGDTFIKPRAEVMPPGVQIMQDPPTDMELKEASVSVTVYGGPPSELAEIPGPASEPVPTGFEDVRPPASSRDSASSAILVVGAIVFAAAAVAAVLFLG